MIQRKVILWSVIVAIGGFIFGFDTVVISGAEQAIQAYWKLGALAHGLTTSIAIVGTVCGAFFGRIPADALGRKKSLVIIALIFLFSALFSSFATNWYLFMIFRFIGGIGVGASSIIAPIYISEISPAAARGRLVVLFQFNIVFGIVIALLSNLVIVRILGPSHNDAWRYMLGVMAVPSLIFLLLLKLVPESPRWLLLQGRYDEAKDIFKIINPSGFELELESIVKSNKEDAEEPGGKELFSGRYKVPARLAVLIAFFNQVSGINAILYYAPRIFEMTGLGKNASLASSLGLGIVNFTFTMIAIRFIDSVGRRKLMFIGSIGLILTLGLVSFSFFTQNFSGYYIIIYLSLFIAFFSFSQGAVIWVFISEIFPNQVRAKGQTLGSFTHWFMAALITFIFPYFTEKLGGGNTFLFFTIMMVFQLLFVWKMMPETKGKSLEDIEHTLIGH
ncbi:sugar porter family MFS transporter [Mucilaginibacter sp.]|uniref:sugar porter family MFS transporter n=1 Tax=Mucilaginibacter sp. TaxID=1882438 RepID=UPI00283D8F43|nr:sugar porter family MFS transporter [Mucilaginibacter sp.]MDR3693742.1 sugar porter family MFS transporter [Mucilaginibacter sp.]